MMQQHYQLEQQQQQQQHQQQPIINLPSKFEKIKSAAKQDRERIKKEENETKKKNEKKRHLEQQREHQRKSKPSQAPNPKKDRLIRGIPNKRFLDDPSRIIEPHEFVDFRKEISQVLHEVRQEMVNNAEPVEEEYNPKITVLLDSPTRTNPSLMEYFSFNNTQPMSPPYKESKLPPSMRVKRKNAKGSDTEKRTGGVMELAKVQTYLTRILRPEEFSIQSATKRLDIFEEDRKRIMRSPWLQLDDQDKQQLVSKPGVFDFFTDWNDDILDDLKQLSMAVDQVLGIAPPPTIPDVAEIIAPPPNALPDNVADNVFAQQQQHQAPPPQPPTPKEEEVKKEPEVTPKTELQTPTKEEEKPKKKEEPKKLTKEEAKKQERQKELDDLIKDNFDPSDVFAADSDEEKVKKNGLGEKNKKQMKKQKKNKKDKKERKMSKDKQEVSQQGSGKKKHSEDPARKISNNSDLSGGLSPQHGLLSPCASSSDILSPEHQKSDDLSQSDDRNEIIRRRMEDRVDRTKHKRRKKSHPPQGGAEGEVVNSQEQATKEAVRSLSFEQPSPEQTTPANPEETEKESVTEKAETVQMKEEVDEVNCALKALEDDFGETPEKKPEKKQETTSPKPETPKQVYNPKRRWMPQASSTSTTTTLTSPPPTTTPTTPKVEVKVEPKQPEQKVVTQQPEAQTAAPTPTTTTTTPPKVEREQVKVENVEIEKPKVESMREFSDDEAIDNRLRIVEDPPPAVTPVRTVLKETAQLHHPIQQQQSTPTTPKQPPKKAFRRISQPDLRVSPKPIQQQPPIQNDHHGLRRISVSSNESGSVKIMPPVQQQQQQQPQQQQQVKRPMETKAVPPPRTAVKQPERAKPRANAATPAGLIHPQQQQQQQATVIQATPTPVKKQPMAIRTNPQGDAAPIRQPIHHLQQQQQQQQQQMRIIPQPNVVQVIQQGPAQVTTTTATTPQAKVHQQTLPNQSASPHARRTVPQQQQQQATPQQQQQQQQIKQVRATPTTVISQNSLQRVQQTPQAQYVVRAPQARTVQQQQQPTQSFVIQPQPTGVIQIGGQPYRQLNDSTTYRQTFVTYQPRLPTPTESGQSTRQQTPQTAVVSGNNPFMPPDLNPVTTQRAAPTPSRTPGIILSPTPAPLHPQSTHAQAITRQIPYPIHSIQPQLTQEAIQPQQEQREASNQRQVDVVRLIERYRIMWQGMLCLKNDSATVQLHFIWGSNRMAEMSLPSEPLIRSPAGVNLPQLRIIQRMRLEMPQVDTVQNKMYDEQQSCTMIALPCGRDENDVHSQTESLRSKFIEYLSAKAAAGIVNIPGRGNNQQYVLHIFPPCEFVTTNLSRLAPDFLQNVQDLPMLMVVITGGDAN